MLKLFILLGHINFRTLTFPNPVMGMVPAWFPHARSAHPSRLPVIRAGRSRRSCIGGSHNVYMPRCAWRCITSHFHSQDCGPVSHATHKFHRSGKTVATIRHLRNPKAKQYLSSSRAKVQTTSDKEVSKHGTRIRNGSHVQQEKGTRRYRRSCPT